MGNTGLDQPLIGSVLGKQLAKDAGLLRLPMLVDLDEDVDLVVEPAIEGLRREAGTPRDLVGVGAEETGLVELARCGKNELFGGAFSGARRIGSRAPSATWGRRR